MITILLIILILFLFGGRLYQSPAQMDGVSIILLIVLIVLILRLL